ncbi:MAG: thiol:disulfide interchange protein DsbA/DsbL [Gammaproteobacteria bacterium]|nr:thiol:disulfide interchange protein DsbA/DsbL [Gammaproteobacteria bacterium]
MRKFLSVIIGCLLSLSLFAATANFVVGKDYQILSTTAFTGTKVHVIEFFNPGCPACFHAEPAVERWLKNKPSYVTFKRVPLVYHREWLVYAKAYYIAKAYAIDNKIVPVMFDMIHKQRKPLQTEQALAALFAQQGIKPAIFAEAFKTSPSITAQLKQADVLMQKYKVYEIPTLVINGKYKTDLGMAKGNPQRLMAVVNFLINKAKSK